RPARSRADAQAQASRLRRHALSLVRATSRSVRSRLDGFGRDAVPAAFFGVVRVGFGSRLRFRVLLGRLGIPEGGERLPQLQAQPAGLESEPLVLGDGAPLDLAGL